MKTTESKPTELRRDLTLLDSTMVNVGTMIGSAIFIVPAAMANQLPSASLVILVWVAGGIISLLGALAVAELGAAMPEAGGQYVYLREAYGPVYGFLYGWTAFMVINTASIAAIAVAFATYLGFFIPLSPIEIKGIAILSTVLLTVINCFGLKAGAWTQNVFTLTKMAALAMLVIVSFTLGSGSSNYLPLIPEHSPENLLGFLGIAMVAALWAYDGWIEITYVASEVKNPQRNLPLSIILSTLIVIALYVLTNLAYFHALSFDEIKQSKLIGADAVTALIGPAGAALVTVAILISTLGSNNGIVFTAARIPYAMAKEGLFFNTMAKVDPKTQTPLIALIIQGIWACILTLSGTYDQLFTYMIFASFVFYAMSCGAVIILRRKFPNLPRPYKVWGYPYTPLIFIGFALWLVYNTIVEAPRDAAIGGGIILLGLPVYYYWKRLKSAKPKES